MSGRGEKIVADGGQRLRDARDYPAVRRQIRAEVMQRHAVEMKAASFFQRLRLHVKIRREIDVELGKIFPRSACHVATPARDRG